MSKKNLDKKNRLRDQVIAFRVSKAEDGFGSMMRFKKNLDLMMNELKKKISMM